MPSCADGGGGGGHNEPCSSGGPTLDLMYSQAGCKLAEETAPNATAYTVEWKAVCDTLEHRPSQNAVPLNCFKFMAAFKLSAVCESSSASDGRLIKDAIFARVLMP
eukprot:TRINITY_DN46008_c0_g1_i1.p2 TRINITY_DN46008_c0_g1~~TRINITY_DN46008_c0_g1_i1.p2  ORF type:complete len:106 (+),score=13.78 TRINITY_DN46008_c0_g1_i1:52-369(+)